MKHVKSIINSIPAYLLATCLCMMAVLCTGCSSDIVSSLTAPAPEELMEAIPEMDPSAYNSFLFTMSITAANASNDTEEFKMYGALETQGNISHLYNLDITLSNLEHKTQAEAWTNYATNERYADLGNGFMVSSIANSHAVEDLADAIDIRSAETLLTVNDSICTLSWEFPTDNDYLFGAILKHVTSDMVLDGNGRITAVFDPETYEFEYFTFVISASNQEKAGAVLDAIFYWDVMNDEETGLVIPKEVSTSAYEASTGVVTDGGYDSRINPLAESFIASYGGAAEITHYDTGASMFWTKEEEGISTTVNYARENNPSIRYDESYAFLMSFYETSAEETENEAYFYDSSAGELTYITKGDDWYAEIIITGPSGTTQGSLRKSLITYKSKLGI